MIPSFWKEVISEEEKTCCLTYVYDYSIKTTVQIPEEYEGYRVVKVDDEVWGKLMKAEHLILPSGIERVGVYYPGNPEVETVQIDDLHWYLTAGGIHHNRALINYYDLLLNGQPVREVVYPQDLTTVMPWQFLGCASLESVVLHDGITEIGTLAFARTNLKRVVIPGSVKRIASEAFDCCDNLERLEIQEGVECLGGAFNFCDALKEVYLPSSICKVTDWEFTNCSSDLVIHIPNRAAFERIEFTRAKYKEEILQYAVFEE